MNCLKLIPLQEAKYKIQIGNGKSFFYSSETNQVPLQLLSRKPSNLEWLLAVGLYHTAVKNPTISREITYMVAIPTCKPWVYSCCPSSRTARQCVGSQKLHMISCIAELEVTAWQG
ncbi:hypothetical protein VP01_1084g3 [Puccinia sorghi]|uniref:Uncharacterized protein n=1 Tax=Puccinia sorghi TaxID=27349 RepID=A0A0L6VT91_9BASI|nr:hypothetical protein VP01_1084g3 [Puccinia sorghi]